MCAALSAACIGAPGPGSLPRSAPEAEGVSAAGVLAFVEAAERDLSSLHSVMVVRHGKVVAEGWWRPYDASLRHELYSLSKSFTSTAVGMAQAEGRLSIDDTVLSFFPDEAPEAPSDNLKAMRIRDLLRMQAGHQAEIPISAEKMTTKAFLAQPVPFKPGTRFLYNTPATFMCSAIVQKVTGQTVRDYLKPRLFDPLGIETPPWATNVQGIALGGYGLSVRTEDIAKFGLLYLQKGVWTGKRLLPEAWVDEATRLETSNGSNPKSDWDQGYGYQFWRCRHGAFRGDGAMGQYCVVMPEQDAVVAITSGLKDMQAVLNLVWDKLLPAIKPGKQPKDRDADARLKAKLASLLIKPAPGSARSAIWDKINRRKFSLPANDQTLESLSISSGSGEKTVLELTFQGNTETVTVGHGEWERSRAAFGPFGPREIAASGGWTDESTYTAHLRFVETPYTLMLKLHFDGDEVTWSPEFDVFLGPTKQPELKGRAK
jgi:CubicO group peptidase (beta-lactamase class C family)